jgi:hypothetical protein
MTTKEFVEELKKSDLTKVAYEKITEAIICNKISFPYTTAIIRKGNVIERGRINNHGEVFNSEFEISYRTDRGNISEFGRGNRPYQSRFYGAMISEEIKFIRIVLFSELVDQFREFPDTDFETSMTIGRWYVKEDFEVADVCFSEKYLNVNELKNRYKFWVEKIKDADLQKEDFKNLIIFFSNEFAKTQIKNHFDYKLSCLYTDIAIHANGLNGVFYPSVKTNYKANNIVLEPTSVEKYLDLREVAMFRYIIKNKCPIVLQTHYSNDLGSFNSRFNWKEFVQT